MPQVPSQTENISERLRHLGADNKEALDFLVPLLYGELRRLAHAYLREENTRNNLETTELVHEAYLQLANQTKVRWQNRAHFFGVAAAIMRRVLVDRARRQKRLKRGGGLLMVSIDRAAEVPRQSLVDILGLDEALANLAELDCRKARIVELRFFGGLSVEETAEFLNLSAITVMRDWRMAKAWLHRELSECTQTSTS